MSVIDKLLSNIHEDRQLLGFLKDEYPKVLEEWKSKGAGGPIPATNTRGDSGGES
jgi:hypothetical protein